MGLFVQCFYALSLHLVAVVFGTAIPTSLYISGKCFIYLYIFGFKQHPASLYYLYSTENIEYELIALSLISSYFCHYVVISFIKKRFNVER